MIELTRLNGNALFINCDSIKWVEAAPDTVLTLMNGEKVVVREPCGEVVERVTAYRVRLWQDVAQRAPGSPHLNWSSAPEDGGLRKTD
jgi:flagellar protein FlbD